MSKNKGLIIKQFIRGCIICCHLFAHAVDLNITQAGLYTLGDDITSLPTGADNIINITVSDVLLDLNNNFISQGNATANVNGIVVNSSLSNITIKNGTVRNVTGTGILINQLCSRIKIDSINFVNCTQGLSLSGSVGNVIVDTFINNCGFFACNSPGGGTIISLTQCSRLKVYNCVIADALTAAVTIPLSLANVTVSDFNNITIQGNSVTTFFGINELNGIDNSFNNIIVRNNSGSAGLSGIRVIGATGDLFTNCLVTLNTTNGDLFGFNISGVQSSIFQANRVTANTGNNSCTGFNVINTSNTISIVDCIANANVSAGTMIGYIIDNSNFSTFVRNMAISNSSTAGTSIGISLQGAGGTSDAFVDFYAARNTGVAAANSFGINVAVAATTLFTRSTCFNNGTNTANQVTGVAAGSTTNLAAPGSNNMNSTSLPWTNLGINA